MRGRILLLEETIASLEDKKHELRQLQKDHSELQAKSQGDQETLGRLTQEVGTCEEMLTQLGDESQADRTRLAEVTLELDETKRALQQAQNQLERDKDSQIQRAEEAGRVEILLKQSQIEAKDRQAALDASTAKLKSLEGREASQQETIASLKRDLHERREEIATVTLQAHSHLSLIHI